jgi:hypothetical protein
MTRRLVPLALVSFFAFAAPAGSQSLGMFRWQLRPFGSVLNLNVTQQGSVYLLNGFESQCSNPSLPAWGVAVPQPNGSILIGVTTITEQGNGLHTRASISPSDFSGGWSDNANSFGSFVFNPGDTCPGGPRIGPIEPEPALEAASPHAATSATMLNRLLAEVELMRNRLAELEAKQPR